MPLLCYKDVNMETQAACDFVGRHYKELIDDLLAGKAFVSIVRARGRR